LFKDFVSKLMELVTASIARSSKEKLNKNVIHSDGSCPSRNFFHYAT